MKVKDFCKLYNITQSAVYAKIKKHRNDILEGHVTKQIGSSIELDETAVEYLRPKSAQNFNADIEALTKRIEKIEKLFPEHDDRSRADNNSADQYIFKRFTLLEKRLHDTEKVIKELTERLNDAEYHINDLAVSFDTRNNY